MGPHFNNFISWTCTTDSIFENPTNLRRCGAIWSRPISRFFVFFRDNCPNSTFFMFISVIEFVNLKLNMREWQIVCDDLESLNVELVPQTRFFKNRPLYNAVDLWNTNVFSDISSISKIIIEIQAFSGLHRSLNNKLFANSSQHSGNHLFSIIFNHFFWTSNTFRRRNGTEPRALPGAEWSGAGEKCLRFKKSG